MPGVPSPRLALSTALEAENLVDQHDGDTPGRDFSVDNHNLVHRAANAVRSLGAGVLEPIGVFVDAKETFFEVGHDLLRPYDENESSGAADIRPELAAAHRSGQQRPGLLDRVDAPEHDIRSCAQTADLVRLGLAIHAPDPRAGGRRTTRAFEISG